MTSGIESNKFKFNKTITLGDVLIAIGLIVPLVIWLVRLDSKVAVVSAESTKQGTQINSIVESQTELSKDMAIVKTMIEERTSKKLN